MNIRIVSVACLITMGGGPWAVAQNAIDIDQVNDAFGLTNSVLTDVRVTGDTDVERTLETRIDDEPVTLFLMPYCLRTDDFEVIVQDATGALVTLDTPPPSKTVRGTVIEWPGSYVVGSLRGGRLTAHIQAPNDRNWYLEPLAGRVDGARAETHVAYRPQDVIPLDNFCGTEDHGQQQNDAHAPPNPEGRISDDPASFSTGTWQATEISFDSDVQFYTASGSSVAGTVDAIEEIMVGVDDIYRNDVGISYVLNRIVVRTAEPDPYNSSDSQTLLAQFRNVWEGPLAGQERDVAHLMTGRDLAGSIIGRAYIGQVCARRGTICAVIGNGPDCGGYGLSQRITSGFPNQVGLVAHELGHNWNAPHCAELDGGGNCPSVFPMDCYIMCACLGGCAADVTQFGPIAFAFITNFRDGSNCLDASLSVTYVDDSFNGPDENGSMPWPYNTFREGVWATNPEGRVIFFPGVYDADRTTTILNRPLFLEATAATGSARIGQ